MGTGADVVVVGGGPVGVLIANLLGVYGVQTLVLERSPEILDYPRAVGMDDEALRVLQAAGLAQDILRDAVSNVPMRMFTADRRCFADILPTTREFGWYRRNIFSQPLAEQALRLVETGAVAEWDFFGIESSYYPFAPIDLPNDGMRLNLIAVLIARGYGAQVTMSQDICTKTRLKRYGGHGYGHLIENVMPIMRLKNFDRSMIEQILIGTPRRLLTLV